MKETAQLLSAFDTLCDESAVAALATVVRVSGSSYRRPGARMLVAADGRSWGGVSGGCLERDVCRRARNVIASGKSDLCRYDTTDDFGTPAALGCAGIIDILIEPLSAQFPGPFPALRRVLDTRQPEAIATNLTTTLNGAAPSPELTDTLKEVTRTGVGGVRTCGGVEVFFEILRPPQSLVLFGGGPDAVPVVDIAKTLGWRVSVIASHATVGFAARFSAADSVSVGTDEDPLGGAAIDADTAVVLMTHNYPRDLLILPLLLARTPRYVGLLGPRRRAERLVLECPGVTAGAVDFLHAPVGLDLGADTPQSIALSIVAEIQAVLAGRPCHSLRDREGPIYPGDSIYPDTSYPPVACPMSA